MLEDGKSDIVSATLKIKNLSDDQLKAQQQGLAS